MRHESVYAAAGHERFLVAHGTRQNATIVDVISQKIHAMRMGHRLRLHETRLTKRVKTADQSFPVEHGLFAANAALLPLLLMFRGRHVALA